MHCLRCYSRLLFVGFIQYGCSNGHLWVQLLRKHSAAWRPARAAAPGLTDGIAPVAACSHAGAQQTHNCTGTCCCCLLPLLRLLPLRL
jgi:hypothetical protein